MRLKRRRLIRPLFDRSRDDVASVSAGCIRLVYRLACPEDVGVSAPVQVGFAVGRRAGKAVVRNRIKRLMREVYRVHQHGLVDLFSRRPETLTLMVLLRGDTAQAEACIPHDLPRALGRMATRLAEAEPPTENLP